ncbi:MAG: hypothetical protein H0U74_08140 [Bradymonadaceae bacterium]|nr:hypothetical protein [Lujinxingiaceae bacterium]
MHRLIAIVLLAALLAPSLAFAQTQTPRKKKKRPDVQLESKTSRVHIPGARWDYGWLENSHAIGLGYIYAIEREYTWWELALLLRAGVGADVKLVTVGFGGIDGFLSYATSRATAIGDIGGATLELGLGAGGDSNGIFPAAQAGIYYSASNYDIGYSYQTPIGTARAPWLSQHQISARFHLPIGRH